MLQMITTIPGFLASTISSSSARTVSTVRAVSTVCTVSTDINQRYNDVLRPLVGRENGGYELPGVVFNGRAG